MDYAQHKITNKIILASDPSAGLVPLICPVCKFPVLLRAGIEIRKHFAHFSGLSSEECSLFHPSTEVNIASNLRIPISTRKIKKERFNQVPAIFLVQNDKDDFELKLRLPVASRSSTWSGSIRVQTIIGERILKWDDLSVHRFLTIHPSIDQNTIQQEGEINENYWLILETNLPVLEPTGNWFKPSQIAGRLLNEQEQIYWGETYWILLKIINRDEESEPKELNLSAKTIIDDWVILELKLPNEHMVMFSADRKEIEDWCGREIYSGRPSSILLHPLPHGFNEEGDSIIPSESQEITLEFTEGGNLMVIDEDGEELAYTYVDENTVNIHEIKTSLSVFVDNILTQRITPSDYTISSPPGIQVEFHEKIYSLYELSQQPAICKQIMQSPDDFSLLFPGIEYERAVKVNGESWISNKHFRHLLKQSIVVTLSSKGFGSCDFSDKLTKEHSTCPEHMKGQLKFLTGLAQLYQKDPTALLTKSRKDIPNWVVPLLRKWPSYLLPQAVSFFRELSKKGIL